MNPDPLPPPRPWRATRSMERGQVVYRLADLPTVFGTGRTDAAARAALLHRLATFTDDWDTTRTVCDELAVQLASVIRLAGNRAAVARIVDFGS